LILLAKEVLITVIGMSSVDSGKYKVNIGDKLLLVKEPNNKHDADAIRVYLEDGSETVGWVGQKTAKEDCITATDLQSMFEQKTTATVRDFDTQSINVKNGGTRDTRVYSWKYDPIS